MYEDKMKNQNYKLRDLIQVWMKACFKRAMQASEPNIKRCQPQQQTERS